MNELIEWGQKYATYVRRHMEVSPARRDLSFAPTERVWNLLLRQEPSIDRRIERKPRLLWAMQEEDRKRKQDQQWQGDGAEEAEAAKAREVEARAEEAERGVEELAERLRNFQEQSRQAAENKGKTPEERGLGGQLSENVIEVFSSQSTSERAQCSDQGTGPRMIAKRIRR